MIAWALACAAATCLPLFFGSGYYSGNGADIGWLHVPIRTWAGEAVRSGELPLWNPHLFNGYPAWVFRPPLSSSLLLWYLSADAALVFPWQIMLHMAWLHLGTQLWLGRGRGQSAAGALLGAQTLMLCGFLIAHLFAGHLEILEAIAWAPWVLWGYEIYQAAPSARRLLLTSLAIALMMMSGHFQFAYLVLWTAVVWNAARVLAGELPGASLKHYALRLGSIALTSGALCAFHLLPMALTLPWLNRSQPSGDFLSASVQPLSAWITWLSPDVMNLHSTPLNWSLYPLWEAHAYMGVFVPVLLLAGGWLPQRRGTFAFLAFTLLLSFGPQALVFEIYRHLDPILGLFRVPSRFVLAATICCAALVGDYWDKEKLHVGRCWVLPALCGLAAVLVAFTSAWPALISALSGGKALAGFQAGRFPDSLETMRSVTGLRLLAQAGLFTCAILLAGRWRKSPHVLVLLALLTCVDGARLAYPYWARREQPLQLPAPWVQAVRDGAWRGVVDLHVTPHAWGAKFRAYQVDGIEISVLAAYQAAFLASVDAPPDSPGFEFYLFGKNRLTELLSVRYYLTQRPPSELATEIPGLRLLHSFPGLYMYENPSALARVQCINRLVPESSSRRYDDLRYLLSRSQTDLATWRGEPWVGQGAKLDLHSADWRLNRVKLDVSLSAPAVLSLSDGYAPGWTARVDGQTQRVLPLNAGLCRGVRLEAGRHTVEFAYTPPGILWSALVSLATLSGLIFASLRTLRATPV